MNSEIFPKNYLMYRKDRNIHSGGVFIWLRSQFHHPSYLLIQHVRVQLHTCTHFNIILGSFYCAPNFPNSIWKELTRFILEIRLHFPNDEIIWEEILIALVQTGPQET